jgi:hypothetical protein
MDDTQHFWGVAPAKKADELRAAGATVFPRGSWPDGTPWDTVTARWTGTLRLDPIVTFVDGRYPRRYWP